MAVRRIKHIKACLNHDSNADSRLIVSTATKDPREYCSIKCNQSGFDVDSHTARAGHAIGNTSQIGDFHLDSHRPLPDNTDVSEAILQK
jgi:putative transposase